MKRRDYWALVMPSLIVMVGLLVLPLYRTLEWSLKEVDYGAPGTWIGLDNYATALGDSRFHDAVLFTVGLTFTAALILVVGGYVLAYWVNSLGRTRPVVLGILLVSYVVPQIVGATMFSWLFNSNFGGLVNFVVTKLTGESVLWFTDVWPNRLIILANIIWFMLPFAMMVILAGLQGVSDEIVEAAKIDGAHGMQVYWHVIIPSIRGVLGFVALISIMDVVRTYDSLIPLSPQAVQLNNESIMLYIYNVAFRDGGQDLGLGSAINVLLIVLIVVLLFPFIRDVAREGTRR